VLIYEMSAGKAPFETYSISQAHVESKTMTRILDGDLSIPKTLSLNLQKLIESILMTEPEQRPSLEEIECSVWLQAYKDEGVEVCQEIWQFWVDREQ
jgi:serine/threonine protein kinase